MGLTSYGYGSGYSSGYGYGYGSGSGYGYETSMAFERMFWKAVAEGVGYSARQCLDMPNTEIRRIMIECLGLERFYEGCQKQIVHQDRDGYDNPRELSDLVIPGAQDGKVRVIRYQCPSTGRIYINVAPRQAKTCQEAIAAKFGVKNYAPEYEG